MGRSFDLLSDNFLFNAVVMIPIFLLALSVHEWAHAISAKWGGDMTASMRGRVTLNPISHIDPIGTVLIPLFMLISGLPLIGWAKPVPTVDTNYRKGRKYGIVVAMAGPFSNLILALFAAILLQVVLIFAHLEGTQGFVAANGSGVQLVITVLLYSIYINLLLMIFNLIPVPPLDGSWLVYYLYVLDRPHLYNAYETLYRFGFLILLALLWLGILREIILFVLGPGSNILVNFASFPLRFL